jgi:tRNA dimethylallyltransferase
MAEYPTRSDPPASPVPPAAGPDPLRPLTAVDPTLACPTADFGGAAAARPRLGEDCWFLTGPTAAGKSALALPLARRLGAEIVSVDSMAVYAGLDVGTAKPSAADRAAVPHHCLDLVEPAESFSVAAWLAAAAAAVADCRSRGRQILFVGGTPLYLRALRDGLASLPAADPALREDLAALAAAAGPEQLHARLAAVDPAAAARIHPRDAKRLIRALEVTTLTGRPLSAAQVAEPDPHFESRLMVLDVARATLAERIDRRVEAMFAGGLVEETAAALAAPGGIGPTAAQAAGYTEAIDLLAGRIDRPEAIRRTQARTRQLAKRQRTWFRSFKRATWIGA